LDYLFPNLDSGAIIHCYIYFCLFSDRNGLFHSDFGAFADALAFTIPIAYPPVSHAHAYTDFNAVGFADAV
jgi:hypothetical protein